jgi:hypothetical protein
MKTRLGVTVIAAGLALAGGAGAMGLIPGMKASGDQALIKSAMAAAPKSIAAGAMIIAMGADMKMRTLRSGTNGWTCMPDNPETPGPDPMCADENAMGFVQAWVGHTPPPADKLGFMYMLAGGTDASNTDPYAHGPAPDNHWVKTGPHVMVVGAPVAKMMAGYPRAPDPNTKVPYVMWAGTPYEHLMLPVK